MKSTLSLVIICMSLLSCIEKNEIPSFNSISYEAYTRGSSISIKVEGNQLKFEKNQNAEEIRALDKKQVHKLNELISAIDLKLISSVEIPSTKHQTDGALAGVLTVEGADKALYESPTFDDDNPPALLKPLVLYLKELTE